MNGRIVGGVPAHLPSQSPNQDCDSDSWLAGNLPIDNLDLEEANFAAMASIFADFKEGQKTGSGNRLASSFNPVAPADDPHRLREFYYFTNPGSILPGLRYCLFHENGPKLPRSEQTAWTDIYVAFWTAVGELIQFDESPAKGSWVKTFDAWKELANVFIRGYSNGGLQAWTLPCLYVVGKYLRVFAMRADAEIQAQGSGAYDFQDDFASEFEKSAKLEDTARTINRMFILCLSDRAPIEDSRKWGIYNMTNLMFKTYFKLKSIGLCKNLLRALDASSADLPDLDAFPKSHTVTFNYYVGLIHFLDENYGEAEEYLNYAWRMCHKDAYKNRELILTFFIPCHIVTTHKLPSKKLLAPFPRLEALFRPLCDSIKKGDLVGFDTALAAGEDQFIKRRIYLTLERGRNIALRNLFRKVFIAGGFDEPKDGQPPIRRTRVPVAEFAAALRIGTNANGRTPLDIDHAECLLANLIYKGLMKGYIARDRGMVVLSKGGTAFPGTGV